MRFLPLHVGWLFGRTFCNGPLLAWQQQQQQQQQLKILFVGTYCAGILVLVQEEEAYRKSGPHLGHTEATPRPHRGHTGATSRPHRCDKERESTFTYSRRIQKCQKTLTATIREIALLFEKKNQLFSFCFLIRIPIPSSFFFALQKLLERQKKEAERIFFISLLS